MIFSLAKIASVLPGFNRVKFTPKMFFEICEKEGLEIVFDEMPELRGFVCKFQNQNYIFLDNNLRGFEFLYIGVHELAHYFLHEPRNKHQVRFYSLARPSMEEDEADAAALLALFPKTSLSNYSPIFESEFEEQKYYQRLEIYKNLGE